MQDHPFQPGHTHLATVDPVLARIIADVGPCTLQFKPDRFAALTWAILSQQVSSAAARTFHRRLVDALGGAAPSPEAIARVAEPDLRAAGLSAQKARYLHALAAFVADGRLDLSALDGLDDEAVAAQLVAVPGIGRWTADMFLIFTLARPDVLPLGDLAVREAISHHYGIPGGRDFSQRALAVAAAWRPWRSLACWYFYRDADARKGRPAVV